MSRTCVSASERDSRRTDRTGGLHTGHIVLALTSVVAMLVIGLAYAGRLQTSRQQPVRVIDLNTVSSSKELEPILERPAAQALFDFIQDVRQEGRVLPNVGAILKAGRRASIRAHRSIEPLGAPARLQTPAQPPLRFTPRISQPLSRPSWCGRWKTFGRLTLSWSALYFLSFWVVALLWQFVQSAAWRPSAVGCGPFVDGDRIRRPAEPDGSCARHSLVCALRAGSYCRACRVRLCVLD